eukprot:g10181.t1
MLFAGFGYLVGVILAPQQNRFTKFTAEHGFTKPNDERGLLLMAECARQVMSEWSDLVMAYGQSDEFSFLLPASSPLYGRRSAKLSTSFVSLFSSSFVFFWPKHFPDTPLLYPPNFDARIVSYPSAEHVRDYFAWRQADCHINNLYNTCFWALVADGVSKQDAQVALKGTTSGDKNELLFSRFHTNYNDIPQRFRKGTTLFRARPTPTAMAAVAPQGPGERPQQPPPKDDTSANSVDKTGGCNPPSENDTPPEGSPDAEERSTSTGQQGGQQGREETDAPGPKLNLAPVESVGGAGSPADGKGREKEDPAAEVDEGKAQAGMANAPPQPGKGEGEKAVKMETAVGGVGGRGRIAEKAKAARADRAVVEVVSSGDNKGRTKRLLKKGHAPPGAIEEDACDLIRDDFWERNPHVLGWVAASRR